MEKLNMTCFESEKKENNIHIYIYTYCSNHNIITYNIKLQEKAFEMKCVLYIISYVYE